jgi:tetratricopeptide (TPR) repeat protein
VFVRLKNLPKTLLAAVLVGAVVASLTWRCCRDPEVTFLPGVGQTDWIVFPSAPEMNPHPKVDLDVVFRRMVTLDRAPREARLRVRAARRFELRINGNAVETGARSNWKKLSEVNVAAHLRPGANALEVIVYNPHGPPALCLTLETEQVALRTDEQWEACCAGSTWRHAIFATTSRVPGRGNVVAGGETTAAALREVWPRWLVLGVAAMVLWWTGRWWLNAGPPAKPGTAGNPPARNSIAGLILLAGLWALLFIHNAALVPPGMGFDSASHLEYIRYLQQRRALPFANEGFEMFQPPLYYGISALGLSLCGLSVAEGGTFLRMFSMVLGVAQFTLIFLILRRLFPGRTGLQWVGLMFAAFLPMQLYLSHCVTNETLAATLASATIYLCLRLLQAKDRATAQYAGLGLCMGAALLSKVTDVLLVPFVIVVLAFKLARQRPSAGMWLRTLGLTLAACFAVCGWYYFRVWNHFGTPFVGNWQVSSGFAWWQDYGYRTWADYARFGRALVNPLFSSFAGVADGVYSTLWGDGLCSGAQGLLYRPAWNYNLMAADYLLALVPTLMLLCGAGVALRRLVRQPASEHFLLLGFFAAAVFGLLWVSLTVPSYAEAKAFYGLCTLSVLCFFGAIGWEVLTRGRKLRQFALGTMLLVWAMSSFASFWVRAGSASTRTSVGLWLAADGKTDAALSEFAAAVAAEPANARARLCLAMTLKKAGRMTEALEHARRAVELNPSEPTAHWLLGSLLAGQGQAELAISEERKAVEVGPEYPLAYQYLADWYLQLGRYDEAIDAARAGLAVSPYLAALHHTLGLAWAGKGDLGTGANQLANAVRLRPRWVGARLDLARALLRSGQGPRGLRQLEEASRLWPDSTEVLNQLAWALATNPDPAVRDAQKAVRLAEQGCALAEGKDARLLSTLAAAYAEASRFPEAIDAVQRAIALAQTEPSGRALLALDEEMLKCFQSGHPYRQTPTPMP